MKMSRFSFVPIAIALAVGVAAVMGAIILQNRRHEPAVGQLVAEPTAVVPTLPGFVATWGGSGTLTVPSQLAPGTYLVGPDEQALGCGWQRLDRKQKALAGALMGRGSNPQLVTVERTDRYVRFLGGCAFRRVS